MLVATCVHVLELGSDAHFQLGFQKPLSTSLCSDILGGLAWLGSCSSAWVTFGKPSAHLGDIQ